MRLPNRSHLLRVAEFRYIQAKSEPAELSNPDVFAGRMLSWSQRAAFDVYNKLQPRALRARPFYYYLVARTRYYDQVLLDAVNRDGARYVVIIGCGGDTRPYRFDSVLRSHGVRVLECDQPEAVRAKQRIVKRNWPTDHVEFMEIDLNAADWPEFGHWLENHSSEPGLVILEGVSPYIDDRPFAKFLEFLAVSLNPGSKVAYDFKIAGVLDQWGRAKGSTIPAFRFPADRAAITEFHERRGFSVDFLEYSGELTLQRLPSLGREHGPLFEEDGLLQISPMKRDRTDQDGSVRD